MCSNAARRDWARLIKPVYEADSLLCPRFRGAMRIIALIDQREVIEKSLTHYPVCTKGRQGALAGPRPRPACGVPVAASVVAGRRRTAPALDPTPTAAPVRVCPGWAFSRTPGPSLPQPPRPAALRLDTARPTVTWFPRSRPILGSWRPRGRPRGAEPKSKFHLPSGSVRTTRQVLRDRQPGSNALSCSNTNVPHRGVTLPVLRKCVSERSRIFLESFARPTYIASAFTNFLIGPLGANRCPGSGPPPACDALVDHDSVVGGGVFRFGTTHSLDRGAPWGRCPIPRTTGRFFSVHNSSKPPALGQERPHGLIRWISVLGFLLVMAYRWCRWRPPEPGRVGRSLLLSGRRGPRVPGVRGG